MPLEERIVAWSKSRPAWQRIVLREVAVGSPMSPEALRQLVDAMVADESIGDADLELGQLTTSTAQAPPVSLRSISEPTHVNALSTTTPLTFPERGLTVVYGDNGSGKSGYARLLKRITRSRHNEDVLSDVFRATAVDQPGANIAVDVGNRLVHAIWPDTKLPEFQSMLFYDSSCGSAYIADEADFPYRPYALFVMDGLIEACNVVNGLVEAKLGENARAARSIPSASAEARETDAGKFLAHLSADSSIERFDRLVERLDESGMSIATVESQEATLRSADTRQARDNLVRSAERFDFLCDHIGVVDSALGEAATGDAVRTRDELEQLRGAAEHHTNSLRSEALTGVGNSSWKVLWESAQRFSETHAYPEHPFPVTSTGSRCVLCLQELSEPGRDVLSRLDRFVRDDVQVRWSETRAKYEASQISRNSLQIFSDAVDNHLRDLETSHPAEVRSVRVLLARYEAVQRAELTIESARTAGAGTAEAENVIAGLRSAAREARALAAGLGDPEVTRGRLHALGAKRSEIELLRQMRAARENIAAETARLRVRRRLEDLKQAANTGPITRKIAELSADTITDVIRDRFTRETERLGLDRVTIAKTRARKGALLHQPKLVGARQSTTLARVFSEGERSALGLAAYFTDASLHELESALILDDPVTSLDHIHRERVANRLVDFAETRQVVVFTHDVAFVADLKDAATRKNVVVAERSVSRSRAGERLPGLCADTHPWKARDVKERIGELRVDLDRFKKQSEGFDDRQYEDAAAGWAGKLSETWERIFSQEVVGQVLADGGLEVRPKMVRVLARFSSDDHLEFDGSYARASRWARRHDKSALVNYVAPSLSELEKELELVDQWFRRVRGYKRT